jgi:hypothetical protein
MPLAFESLSHGTVAFGFFNIDSDMLLLDRHFFFSTEFCGSVGDLSENKKALRLDGYTIDDPASIGNLMGAIHGVEYTGFIGALYKIHPFPEKPEDFRQKPEGTETQEAVRSLITEYARPLSITISVTAGGGEFAEAGGGEIDIGGYRFSRSSFRELILYVWRGGYPRWREDTPPRYVEEMKTKIEVSDHRLFRGLSFDHG